MYLLFLQLQLNVRLCACVCVLKEAVIGCGGGDRLRWRRRWMAPPRLSDEQKALSRQRRRDRRRELQRLRRADPIYRLAERARNTRARREQRNDPEYRKKERERDTRAHRDRRNRVDTVMRNIAGSLWTNGNATGIPIIYYIYLGIPKVVKVDRRAKSAYIHIILLLHIIIHCTLYINLSSEISTTKNRGSSGGLKTPP